MSSIKLTADSGGGTFELKAPASSSNTRSFTLPDVATGLGGILMCDQWYLTAEKTDNTDITANLSRNDRTGAASQIGTGMSQSSGIFTFPVTGKYFVIVNAIFGLNGSDNAEIQTQVTTNNSSYTSVAIAADGNNGSGSRIGSGTSFYFLDVTDTSQVKVKFQVNSLDSGSKIAADSSFIKTGFVFIRIGDT